MQAPVGDKPRVTTGESVYAITQASIATWLVLASRVLTQTWPNAAGALDDVALVALFSAFQLALGRALGGRARVLRAAISLTSLSLLALLCFANVLYFSFFKTNLSVASLQTAGIALDARTSIRELVTAANVGTLLIVPLTAGIWASVRLLPGAALARSRLATALLLVGLLLAGLAGAVRQPVFVFAEHNPAMGLARDGASRALRRVLAPFAGAEDPLAQLPQEILSLLNREGYPEYEPAGSALHPLLQRAPAQPAFVDPDREQRNVVLILMESMRGLEQQGSFREVPVTPFLNALEAESVVFPNFYSNGMTTVDAEFSILCSALPVVNEAPVYIRQPDLDIRCLPEILRERGYSRHWISAYRSSYANKQRFLTGHGVERVHDVRSMNPRRARHPKVGWGMGDVDMFEQALEKIGRFREPFFVEIMTLSNHHPFDHDYDIDFPASLAAVPGDSHYRNYLRGMYYTDHAVAGFIEAAREMPWFSRTLFVIVGDHAVRSYPPGRSGDSLGPVLETEIYFRERLILYGPGWLPAATHEVLGSQIDVAPTLLDLLGIQSDNSFMGVSLFADLPADRRFALMNIGHVWNMRVGDQYCYSVGYSCFERVFPRCPEGVAPTSEGHTCFAAEGDLLLHPELSGAGDPNPFTSLDALERFRILDRAERIMELNRVLIEHDRFR